MAKISKLDFSIENIPAKYVGLGEAIMLIARKLNQVIDELNKRD